MSISSCPRCQAQVTLPTGVSASAVVRCPLCQATYALSDALVNMPPMLELVDDAAVASRAMGGVLGFDDAEVEHDDLSMQEQDTEIEELGLSTSDLPLAESRRKPIDLSVPDDESVFGAHEPTSAAAELPADEMPEEMVMDDLPLDLDDPAADVSFELEESEPEAPFDLDDPMRDAPRARAADATVDFLDLDMPTTVGSKNMFAGNPAETINFEPQGADDNLEPDGFDFDEQPAAAEGEEMALDFGEPQEAMSAAPVEAEPAADAKKKGKKEKPKKEKKPKPEKVPGAKRGRGALVGAVLGLILLLAAIPYGLMWYPGTDLLGLAGVLHSSIVPASFNKPKRQSPPGMPSAPDTFAGQPDDEPVNEEPTGDDTQPADTALASQSNYPTEPGAEPTNPATMPTTNEAPPPAVDDAAPTLADIPTGVPAERQPSLPDPASALVPPPVTAFDEPASKPADADNLDDIFAPRSDNAQRAAFTEETEEVASTEPMPVLRDAPEFDLEELVEAMQAAVVANRQMVAAQGSTDEAEISRVRFEFYTSLFGLAETMTFTKDDPDQPQLDRQRQRIQRMVVDLAGNPERLALLKKNAAKWLNFPKRTTEGIMLTGQVVDVQQKANIHEIKLSIGQGNDARIVTVLQEIEPELKRGETAFVVGSIVEHPDEYVTGYSDSEPIVWSGMSLPIGP